MEREIAKVRGKVCLSYKVCEHATNNGKVLLDVNSSIYNLVTLFNFDFIAIRAIPKNIQTWFCVEQIPKSRKFYLLAGPTYLGNKKAKRNPMFLF